MDDDPLGETHLQLLQLRGVEVLRIRDRRRWRQGSKTSKAKVAQPSPCRTGSQASRGEMLHGLLKLNHCSEVLRVQDPPYHCRVIKCLPAYR